MIVFEVRENTLPRRRVVASRDGAGSPGRALSAATHDDRHPRLGSQRRKKPIAMVMGALEKLPAAHKGSCVLALRAS